MRLGSKSQCECNIWCFLVLLRAIADVPLPPSDFAASASIRFRSSYVLNEAAQDAQNRIPVRGHSVRVRVLLMESEDAFGRLTIGH